MNDVNYELIGTRIREKREEVGCSQEQLAWDAELSNTYISLVETGKKKPSLASVVCLAFYRPPFAVSAMSSRG